LDIKGNKTDIGNVEGFRLPTDAEWEYAARGGIRRCDKPKGGPACDYAGSNNIEYVGWYSKNSSNGTKPVGLKFPNELGIYDMSGNVFEWCWDFYESSFFKKSAKKINPVNINNHSFRVLRGGSWGNLDSAGRVIHRHSIAPDHGWLCYGFRFLFALQFTPEPGKSEQEKVDKIWLLQLRPQTAYRQI
jgi:sulfatase modifying factor 1